MALFGEGDQQEWWLGTIVVFEEADEYPYILFYESDSVWERVQLPDEGVVYRVRGSDARVTVTPEMLPGGEDLD